MGRRKRRKQIPRKITRKLPTIFQCPYCGKQTLSISLKKSAKEEWVLAEAVCGECGFCARLKIAPIQQAIDAYGKLVDLYEAYVSSADAYAFSRVIRECIDEASLVSKNATKEEVQEESER